MSCLGPSLGRSYPSAEVKLVCSTAPADWANVYGMNNFIFRNKNAELCEFLSFSLILISAFLIRLKFTLRSIFTFYAFYIYTVHLLTYLADGLFFLRPLAVSFSSLAAPFILLWWINTNTLTCDHNSLFNLTQIFNYITGHMLLGLPLDIDGNFHTSLYSSKLFCNTWLTN